MTTPYQDSDGNQFDIAPDQVVRMYSKGGGFERKITLEAFLATFVPATKRPYDLVQVSLDTEAKSYKAYFNGDRWNGFVMPYFPKEDADKMAADMACMDGTFVCEGNTYTYTPDGHSLEDASVWEIEQVEGIPVPVVSIGAGSWCWGLDPQPPEQLKT